jgi:colanic acid/amylovoran biosynthesis protein
MEKHISTHKKLLKIGIIGVNPYNTNLGVSALAYSCLSIFKQIIKENNLNAEITLIGSTGKHTDEITIRDEKIRFYNVQSLDYFKVKSILKIILLAKRYNFWRILNSDIIFDISEGDSFTDIYGNKRYKRILNSKRLFNFLNIKQVMLPQTIGPFNKKENENKAFKIMQMIEKIISRDGNSYKYTSQFLPNNKIMNSIDVAFDLPFEKTSFNKELIHVGLNISGLLWHGGYTKNNQFNLKSDYQELIQQTISFFLGYHKNIQLHIIPHVITGNFSVEDDLTVAKIVRKKSPEVIIAPIFNTPIEAKTYISGLDFFVGARMHACIAAFSSGIPVFPMAYSRKFNGLFEDTLQYSWFGDCVNQNETEILKKMKKSFDDRTRIKEEIVIINEKIVTPRLNELRQELLKYLKNA